MPRRIDLRAGRRRGRGDRRPAATTPPGELPRRGRGPGMRDPARQRPWSPPTAGAGSRASGCRRSTPTAARSTGEPQAPALRLPAGLRRLEPDRPPVLAVARQAALRRGARGVRARTARCSPSARPAPPTAALAPGRVPCRGCPGRCRRPPGPPASGRARRDSPTVREPAAGPLLPTWSVPSPVASAARRSSISRTT